MEPQPQKTLTLPIAIVVAGIIIGGAIFFSSGVPTKDVFDNNNNAQSASTESADIALRPVSDTDHILGNPNATIVMVEHSDLECPFCKSFHKTLHTLLDQYGKDGSLAWVYRHFPLEIHPRSPKESEATECAFEQGGNTAFWNFTNKIFEITPANNGLDPAQLPKIAKQLGLDEKLFSTCLESGKYASKIQNDYDDGLKAGVNGTPHTTLILKNPLTDSSIAKLESINAEIMQQLPPGSPALISINPNKQKVGIGGAFQLTMMKQIIDLLLK